MASTPGASACRPPARSACDARATRCLLIRQRRAQTRLASARGVVDACMSKSRSRSLARGRKVADQMLELRDVVRHYHVVGDEVRAVDGVSFLLRAGEMLALQGPSGSGKTTLLLLIAALLKPDSGAIRFEGRDVSALSPKEASDYLLRDVGIVYQNFHLMPRVSALENAATHLMLAGVSTREAETRALPWLERVGLGDRLDYPPERLSGGERQRVAIARTLAAEPRLVLADEPTGNLDSARSRAVVQLLCEVAHEQPPTAVLLVTHDGEAAALADRRLTLRDGRLFDRRDEGSADYPGADGPRKPQVSE